MFKSIQFKIVLIFSILTLSVITVIGSFMLINIASFYNTEFSVAMNGVFSEDLIYQLEQSAGEAEPLERISEAIGSYIGPLGIDSYRFYCIMDENGSVLKTSDASKSKDIDKTDNIILAMAGKPGNKVNTDKSYMDFAVPISGSGGSGYIIYIRDTKEELNSVTRNVITIVLQALLLAIVTSVVIGYFLGKTITVPIVKLTRRSERLASGDFAAIDESKAKDEIGQLSNTFRFMASALHDTIDEMNSEKNKVETILKNMTDGILAFNLDGELIHVNPEARKLLGDFDDAGFNELFSKFGADISMGDLLYIKNSTPPERRITVGGKCLRLSFASIEQNESITGIIVVLHDITRQEKLEAARKEFVANVSHELRTPLATVKSYAETLMTGIDDAELQGRFLSVIVKETDRMTRIVKDLLTLSRLDESKSTTEKNDLVDINSLLEGIAEKLYITAKKKNHTLICRSGEDIPPIKTNRDRLEQVIVNIVSNAVKYTPDGGRIELVSGGLGSDAYIKVIDNGIGIPEEKLPRIFERFYRVDKARSRDTGGTGLGLAIAKQMIEELGGSISIASRVNEGTEVTLLLHR